MSDIVADFRCLVRDFPNAAAGMVKDICNGLSTPCRLKAIDPALSDRDHDEACVAILRQCLRSFELRQWPDGSVDHAAWETLVFILGRWLLSRDPRLDHFSRRITDWPEERLEWLRSNTITIIRANADEWKQMSERLTNT